MSTSAYHRMMDIYNEPQIKPMIGTAGLSEIQWFKFQGSNLLSVCAQCSLPFHCYCQTHYKMGIPRDLGIELCFAYDTT